MADIISRKVKPDMNTLRYEIYKQLQEHAEHERILGGMSLNLWKDANKTYTWPTS